MENGWLQFENAGGCSNVENFINGKLQSFNNLPKDNACYLRCFVLLDSDKTHPNAPLKGEFIKLKKFLEDNSISFHFLEKRCMENYLPDEVWADVKQTHDETWIDAYLNALSPLQKDYLDIAKGFTKKDKTGQAITPRQDLDIEMQQLFDNVSDANFDILDKGWQLPNFKKTFPELFKHHHTHKNTLIQRTAHQQNAKELEHIIEKIKQLL